MVRIFIFWVLLFGVISCVSQKLTLIKKRGNNPISEIRLDGYYVVHDNVGMENRNRLFFLYANGFAYGGTYLNLDAYKRGSDEFYRYITSSMDDRSNWGIFTVNHNKIKLEKWEPSSGGGMKTVIRSGMILNDTTFILTERFNHYNNKEDAIQDTFRFHQYYPKPDSTNRFIK